MTFKRILAIAMLSALALAVAGPVLAAKVMFNGTYQSLPGQQGGYPPYFNATGAPGSVTTAATDAQAFTLQPGKANWGYQLFTFTVSQVVPPGPYPYLYVKRDTYVWGTGSFQKSYFPANMTYTLMHQETHYPYFTLTPGPSTLIAKFGPNGFGGPMVLKGNDIYTGLYFGYAIAGSYSNLLFYGLRYHNPCGLGNLPGVPADPQGCTILPAGGYRTNLSTLGIGGSLWDFNPSMGFFTGTLSSFDRHGADAQTIPRTAMGADDRTAMGTNGRVQLVTPALTQDYFHVGGAPPGDTTGQANIAGLIFETALDHVLTVDFLPEPGQLLMLAAGVGALLGLHRLQRRR